METWTGRRGTIGPRDAVRPLDAARDGGWGSSCVVDRRDAVRLTGAVNLTAEGLQVREAGEGLDALDQARCEGPDLVLTDVKKLGLGGPACSPRSSRTRSERCERIRLSSRPS
jgi:CheY-like chemotaxis protein